MFYHRRHDKWSREAPIKWIVLVLIGAILFGAIFAVVGTYALVVRPLRQRIEAVSRRHEMWVVSHLRQNQPRRIRWVISRDVIAESHTRIIKAQRALEERNRALEHHLAGVAHDLRTPLSSMHLALEALATESHGPVQQEARRALADAVFLSSMVDNLHHATRLRHDVEVTSGRVELCDLIRRLEKIHHRWSAWGHSSGGQYARIRCVGGVHACAGRACRVKPCAKRR